MISVVKIQAALVENMERRWQGMPPDAKRELNGLVEHAQKAGHILRSTGTYELYTDEPGDDTGDVEDDQDTDENVEVE